GGRRREGVRLTAGDTGLGQAVGDVLTAADQAISQARQAAGMARPRLRLAAPADLPDALAVAAAAALRAAADAARITLTWVETALDAEFAPIRHRRADAALSWLIASPDTLPAPLEAMTLGQFQPQVWVPSSHPAA